MTLRTDNSTMQASQSDDYPASVKTSFFLSDKLWNTPEVKQYLYKAYLDDTSTISYWSIQKEGQSDKLEGYCLFRKATSDDDDLSKKLVMLAKMTLIPKRPIKIVRLDGHSEHPVAVGQLLRLLK